MHSCPEWKVSFQHALCLPCRDDFLFATFAMHTTLTLSSSPLLQLLSNLIDASSPGVISTKKAQIQLNCKAGSQEPMIGKECLIIPHPQGAHLGCVSHKMGMVTIHVCAGADHSFQMMKWAVLLISLPFQIFWESVSLWCKHQFYFICCCWPANSILALILSLRAGSSKTIERCALTESMLKVTEHQHNPGHC